MRDAALRSAAFPLVLAGLAFLALGGWYLVTLQEVIAVWDGSETYQHGYTVPFICLWLLWRERSRLLAAGFTPAWHAALPLVLAGAVWLVGDLAAVGSVKHFGLVGMLVSAVWLIWGQRAAAAAAFPLGFLFFAVPFGEFLVPSLMQYTADFTVSALRATGVPVYREGLSFVIPSGSWSVVQACSGIRYLIASVMVGTLYAYLTYTSISRRLLFVLASILVPLIANWLRAYLIVMIGHLSGNTLAIGVDHLIYGWVFFGIVIFSLFWLGNRWRQDEPAPAAPVSAVPVATPVRFLAAFALVLVLGGIWRPLSAWMLDVPAPVLGTLQAPAGQGGWVQGGAPVSVWTPDYVGAVQSFSRSYSKGGETVQFFVYAYAGQRNGRKLVQWNNRLVMPGGTVHWEVVKEGRESVEAGGQPLALRFALLRGAGYVSTWHWLQLQEHATVSDAQAKLSLLKDRLLHDPDYSYAIFVASAAPEARARELVADFLKAHAGAIRDMLAQAER